MTIALIKVDHNYCRSTSSMTFSKKTKSAKLNTRQKPGYIWKAYMFVKTKETRLAVTM